ncbi:Asp23/Gls24 family envelope stress response protein [Nonomuraea terrae]|uniref:Asp23/Gls24 family envelope stress response protein n=1 Tax=Nonomuraea terrae TaxID=2530383 RepID=A0A4R4YU23_9ACTN|nr:Asp23/Gls24 family envelope stress response protein [Nonomuraea terrae]
MAERARACSGVVKLSGGPFGTVATYLPGERLTGVSADEREVKIAIVATLARPLPETAEEVRRAVADLAGNRPVHVRIDDIIDDTVEGS